jgi:hypothetical protein
MSTDDNPVYIGTPDKDGNDHGADAFRYMSMAFETGMVVTDKDITSQKQYQELKRQYA